MQIYRAFVKTMADVNMQFYSHNTLPLFNRRQSPSHGMNGSCTALLLILIVLVRIICKKKKTYIIGQTFCVQSSSLFIRTEISWALMVFCSYLLESDHSLGYVYSNSEILRGADKSLARPTSRSRRTESIVSLERGVCSCAELQFCSCYRGWKEACQATRTTWTT